MSEFKVGDVVECIKEGEEWFDGIKGKKYEVTGVSDVDSIQVSYGGVFNDPNRFKLVTQDKEPKKEPSETSVSIARVGEMSEVKLVGKFTEKQISAIMGITYGWSK